MASDRFNAVTGWLNAIVSYEGMAPDRLNAATGRLNAIVHRLSTATERLNEAIATLTAKERGCSKRGKHGQLKKKKVSRLSTRRTRYRKKAVLMPKVSLKAEGWLDAEPLGNHDDEQDIECIRKFGSEKEASHEIITPVRIRRALVDDNSFQAEMSLDPI